MYASEYAFKNFHLRLFDRVMRIWANLWLFFFLIFSYESELDFTASENS